MKGWSSVTKLPFRTWRSQRLRTFIFNRVIISYQRNKKLEQTAKLVKGNFVFYAVIYHTIAFIRPNCHGVY